jgi:hypothetical protein
MEGQRPTKSPEGHTKKHYLGKKRQVFDHFGVLMTNKTLFRQFLNNAISLALWTKPITCDKTGFKSRFCKVHQAGKIKIGVNQRNPRLINDLRLRKITYEIINLFLQNKANFQKVKSDVNRVLTMDYDQMDTWSIGKTKPIRSQYKANSKPIKAN